MCPTLMKHLTLDGSFSWMFGADTRAMGRVFGCSDQSIEPHVFHWVGHIPTIQNNFFKIFKIFS